MIFFQNYGWQVSLIAIAGIVILGILKYANVFSKIEKEKRKPIYFAISIGFSILATIVYLAFKKQLELEYIVTLTFAIYALNQAFYAIYETTTLRDLMSKILAWFSEKIKEKKK